MDFLLEEVLVSLTSVTTHKAEEKGLELLFFVDPDLPRYLVGDPMRLGQVLTNLTNNAIKFTESGEIVIRVEMEEALEESVRLKFSVKDTGIGLTEKQMGRLFQSFSQADGSTTRKYGGTGLGLAISKKLVEMMNGRIWVESEPGEGSTFSFTASFSLSKNCYDPVRLSAELKGIRTLIVDDSETSRQILVGCLKSLSLDVEIAHSGMRALEMLEQAAMEEKPFGLVLMDWRMPGMDGIEASRLIKSSPHLANIPAILMVTAYGREEIMQQSRETGIDGFLIKPVNQSLLLETILSILGKEQLRSFPSANGKKLDTSLLDGIRGAHVLLVEDNLLNQQVALELMEVAGLRVSVAGNGRKGVEAVLTDSFDLVLMDIQMPEMDGLEATQMIRSYDQLKDLPIVAMTAHAMAGDREKSLDAGMNDHITKPIEPEELYASLLRWIKPGEREASEMPVRRIEESSVDSVELPALSGIDVTEGLRKVAGNTHVYLKILKGFLADYQGAASLVRAEMEEGSLDEAQRAAHTIKGVAGNIGARALFKAAGDLELSLKEGRTKDAWRLHAPFEACMLEVITGLAALDKIGDTRAAQEDPSGKPNLDAARQAAAQMSRLLAEGDAEASDLMSPLRTALVGAGLDAAMDTLEAHIDAFDFEDALAVLDSIAGALEE